MANNDLAVYRLALYGRANSGKTCILAALAMSRHPHPRGYTCVRVPPETPPPKGEPDTWKDSDPVAHRYWGKRWLEDSVERLENHGVPRANPQTSGHLTLVYDFTAPGQGTMRVELLDYSGELLDPELSHEQLAATLRRRLESTDGLLIIGEVPKPGAEAGTAFAELRKLQEAFGLLLANKQEDGARADVPIALLVNKWDRLGAIDLEHPETEEAKLEFYLDDTTPSPLRQLRDALRDAVAEGSFRAFPVSALGECEEHRTAEGGTIERPKQLHPLRSFGLEDGFTWAARRRNEIDVRAFPEAAEKLSPWRLGLPFIPHPVLQKGRRLLARLPQDSPDAEPLREVYEQTTRVFLKRYAVTFFAAVLLALLVETGIDSSRYRPIKTVVEDTVNASEPEIQSARAWLVGYRDDPMFRHLLSRLVVLGPGSTRAAVDAIDRPKIERNEDQLQGLELAAKGLEGKRREEIEKLLEDAGNWPPHGDVTVSAEQQQRFTVLKTHLEGNAQRLKGVGEAQANETELVRLEAESQPAQELDELLRLQGDANAWPLHTDVATAEQRQRHTVLITSLAERIQAAEWRQQDEDLRLDYAASMDSRQITDAATRLANYERQSETWKELCDDFRSRVPQLARQEIDQLAGRGQWDHAYRWLDDLKGLPTDLQPGSLRQQTSAMLRDVQLKHDRFLWQEVRRSKTKPYLLKYMDTAPLRAMGTAAKTYLGYLEAIDNPLPLTLQLKRLEWGTGCEQETDNVVSVSVNGQLAIRREEIDSWGCKPTGFLGSHKFRAKITDNVTVRVALVDKTWLLDDRDQGQSKKTVPAQALQSFSVDLLAFNGVSQRAYFGLDGIPAEPALPAWSE